MAVDTNQYFVGTVGTVIDVDVGTDISTATTTEIRFIKPDKTTTGTWVAAQHPTDVNKIRYTIISGDWDTPGVWTANAFIAFATWSGPGKTFSWELKDINK